MKDAWELMAEAMRAEYAAWAARPYTADYDLTGEHSMLVAALRAVQHTHREPGFRYLTNFEEDVPKRCAGCAARTLLNMRCAS
jgi:hypothetical protein